VISFGMVSSETEGTFGLRVERSPHLSRGASARQVSARIRTELK
jgi:hypothetical protein